MKGNKKKQSKIIPKKPIQRYNFHNSTVFVHRIVKNIIRSVLKDVKYIESQKRKNANQMEYFRISGTEYFYSYLNQMLVNAPTKLVFVKDEQPRPIQMDSLAVSALQKTVNKHISQKSFKSVGQSSSSEFRLPSIQKYKQLSVKLPLQTIQQMKYVSDLRQKKIKDELQIKQQIQLQQKQKSKINNNYDYNGKILYKRNINQGNLINKIILQKLNNQKIIKRVKDISQPTFVQGILKHRNLKKNKSKIIEDQFTQFLDTQSLTDSIQINRGIRYSHNSLVFSEKKLVSSALQLKQKMSKQKISKSDLLRIKQLGHKKQIDYLKKLKTQRSKQSRLSEKRSYSEANFKIRGRREVINVMNPELRQSMLIRLSEYQPYLVIQKEFSEDPSILYEKKQKQETPYVSQIQHIQWQGQSRTIEIVHTPKLPEVNKSKLNKLQDNLIISKLQRQFQDKLRI